ncbi:hypothetical protein BV25DRAFT_1993768 [Artomyces pyxidatus]|uniref:Uncharacterized protein n=1 Tax=Artomyces pyxidatus TaxID=48021 RepID=A0ACB8SRP0_9AGAM|nr:hypothetical protein BV25DRAFT_1993768 [Artomyces pyxidatus]
MPRNSPLQRTASCLSLPEFFTGSSPTNDLLAAFPRTPSPPPSVPYTRTLQHYKAQRMRVKAMIRAETWNRPSRPACTPAPPDSSRRTTSPLAPVQMFTTPRPSFPRSKPEPNLYRAAITGHMRSTPQGQKILNMGARLAVSILTATRELERLVRDADLDAMIVDTKPLSTSWVVVPCDDWEMVELSSPVMEVSRAVAVA